MSTPRTPSRACCALESADGKVLAEAILGKQQHRLTGNQAAGTYLRRPGEAQSWLASGGVELDEQVAGLARRGDRRRSTGERMQRIEIEPAGRRRLCRACATTPAAALQLDGARRGRERSRQDADLDQLAGALASGAARGRQAASPSSPGRTSEHTVERRDLRRRRGHLAPRLAGRSALASGRCAQPPLARGSKPDQATAAEEQAKAIEARTDGWAYQVSDFLFERLTKPRADWIDGRRHLLRLMRRAARPMPPQG